MPTGLGLDNKRKQGEITRESGKGYSYRVLFDMEGGDDTSGRLRLLMATVIDRRVSGGHVEFWVWLTRVNTAPSATSFPRPDPLIGPLGT